MTVRSVVNFLWNDSRVGFVAFGLLVAGISAALIAQNNRTLDKFYGCPEQSRVTSEKEAIRFARAKFGDDPVEFFNISDENNKQNVRTMYERDNFYSQEDNYSHPSWTIGKSFGENYFYRNTILWRIGFNYRYFDKKRIHSFFVEFTDCGAIMEILRS